MAKDMSSPKDRKDLPGLPDSCALYHHQKRAIAACSMPKESEDTINSVIPHSYSNLINYFTHLQCSIEEEEVSSQPGPSMKSSITEKRGLQMTAAPQKTASYEKRSAMRGEELMDFESDSSDDDERVTPENLALPLLDDINEFNLDDDIDSPATSGNKNISTQRNIPTAMERFPRFEEFRRQYLTKLKNAGASSGRRVSRAALKKVVKRLDFALKKKNVPGKKNSQRGYGSRPLRINLMKLFESPESGVDSEGSDLSES